MFVENRFELAEETVEEIYQMTPEFGFGAYGEMVFYRTYSREKDNGFNESWNDVVCRVITGIFSIRKDHYIKNRIYWNDYQWQVYARNMAISLFNMEWLPPGRGLWMCGAEYMYQRGSMALQNCGFTRVGYDIGRDIHWAMDALMNGVGVGFYPERHDDLKVYTPDEKNQLIYFVEDSKEGWCDSTKAIIDSYLNPNRPRVVPNYIKVRDKGTKIKGFGGISSGPEPLIKFHEQICGFFSRYNNDLKYDSVLLKTDLFNTLGVCVVSGNVRRSAELACAPIDDGTFLNLKNYDLYPHRRDFGWMSNNSVFLEKDTDFERLGEIAERVRRNGEPGYINLINLKKGRLGHNDNLKPDLAIGFNPCGEQPLEDKELCTLAESLPTRADDWFKALEYATFYASTVTLLPTHREETNQVMLRNRRIGVSIIDISGWKYEIGTNQLIKNLRLGYKKVRATNRWLNNEAGVPEANRVTTVKPGGTTPKIAGRTSGWNHPNFHYTLRRTRIAANSPIVPLLIKANIPFEPEIFDPNTLVFEFPILQGPAKPSTEVSIWEQAMMLTMLQAEWADNAVSNTLNFKPKWVLIESKNFDTHWQADEYETEKINQGYKVEYNVTDFGFEVKVYDYDPNHEEDDIENVLASIARLTKSVALLPQSSKGAYAQMPEEGITKEEYEKRLLVIKPIDWSLLRCNEAEPEKYCQGDQCVLSQ